jgi:hypothetical protein
LPGGTEENNRKPVKVTTVMISIGNCTVWLQVRGITASPILLSYFMFIFIIIVIQKINFVSSTLVQLAYALSVVLFESNVIALVMGLVQILNVSSLFESYSNNRMCHTVTIHSFRENL